MARSDLLISLIRSGIRGDQTAFRRSAESLIAEERAKKHTILADRLSESLKSNGGNGLTLPNNKVNNLYYEIVPEKTFEDLVLNNEVLEICNELIEEQHRSDLLHSYGIEPRHTILLTGVPGNGKTAIAEAIAQKLAFPMIVIRYESLIGSYLGETASRLQKVFDYVKTQRCVLFFDEFDTIGKERGDTRETGEIKRVVSSLLLQMDSLPSYVVVITASNHPELLDKAVWRRFQLRLNLPMPNKSQIATYIDRFLKRTDLKLGLISKKIAEKLAGHSFAEIEEFCLDVLRSSILTHQDNDAKKIVAKKLKQWQLRLRVKPVSKGSIDG